MMNELVTRRLSAYRKRRRGGTNPPDRLSKLDCSTTKGVRKGLRQALDEAFQNFPSLLVLAQSWSWSIQALNFGMEGVPSLRPSTAFGVWIVEGISGATFVETLNFTHWNLSGSSKRKNPRVTPPPSPLPTRLPPPGSAENSLRCSCLQLM